ncbi:uncharacterized protein LOC125202580 [Salvia hispanica]|uniref:uncharacterized protein LOC125202580 n=1 Tax=Salvia hispanica TaxID=49212 RepID=UPI002008F078|nr:uncharacterized protein LOC125202580 [Salvia hispanica]
MESGYSVSVHIPEDAAVLTDNLGKLMYRAASEGDWVAAEVLLSRYERVKWMDLTDRGDKAIHLAMSGKHKEFVCKLIDMVGCEILEVFDVNGYTACCNAVMDGDLELVRFMIDARPNIVNIVNQYQTTPFMLAVSYGNADIVKHMLGVKINLPKGKWFDLLVVAITGKKFDMALILVQAKTKLAALKGKDGRTALHVLARLGDAGDAKAGLLAEMLWISLNRTLFREVMQLMNKPPILHDAAKVGNLRFIEMISSDFPHLLTQTDDEENSIVHIIAMHRQKELLKLVTNTKGVTNCNTFSVNKYGNNFLHSAAKSIHPNGLEIVGEQDVQIQEAFDWFKTVEEVAPPNYKEMRNNDGHKPIDLFWKEHEELLSKGHVYMKSTAESCMIISTIVLSLVFAAAFAPPGGFDQGTGIPILLKKKWSAAFIIFQVLALSSSTLSIIGFWSIISSNYKQEQFFLLPLTLRLSMCALLLSVLFVISAFLSAFFLVFVQERKALVVSLMVLFYAMLIILIAVQLYNVTRRIFKIIRKVRKNLFLRGMFTILGLPAIDRILIQALEKLIAPHHPARGTEERHSPSVIMCCL